MRPPYKYRSLEPDTVRLLRILPGSRSDDIKCELVHCLNEGIDYSALSYCWGDPAPVGHIQVDDQNLSMASSLLHFLVRYITTAHVRQDMFTFLWIDAVCIDQQNLEEKSAQVNIMWSIYERASQVTVWLGDVTQPMQRALSVAKVLDETIGRPSDRNEDFTVSVSMEQLENVRLICGYQRVTDLFNDMAHLTHHDYFQRMWTYQEVLVVHEGRKIGFKTALSGCSMAELMLLSCALDRFREEGFDQSRENENLREIVLGWYDAQLYRRAFRSMNYPHAVLEKYLLHTKRSKVSRPQG